MADSGEPSSFDVLIVGGGPAGLLLAGLLAPRFRVGLAELHSIGRTSKYWITSRRRLQVHGLADCIYSTYPSAVFGTFLGEPVEIPGDFVVAADKHVLHRLAERARSRGVVLFENCPIVALRWRGELLVASTPTRPITCRVLVDAAGGSSPIAATFRLHDLAGFYTVYGQHLASVSLKTDQLIAGLIPELGYPPVIFEVIPIPPAAVICSAFVITRRARHCDELKLALDRFVKHNAFFSPTADTTVKREKFGAIPIGRLSRSRLPRVIGFGEAGMMQSPLLGGAFNEVLVHATHFSDSLAALLSEPRLEPTWRIGYPFAKRANDWMQLVLAKSLVDGTALGLQRLVEGLNRIGANRAYRLLASELQPAEVPLVALSALLPARAISKADRSLEELR